MKKKFKVLLFYPNMPLLGIAPSNLAVLAAYLKQDGIDVKLFDCTVYKPQNVETNDEKRVKLGLVKASKIDEFFTAKTIDVYEDFVKVVEEYKPDLIGFTLIESSIEFAFEFIEKIKNKNIKIVTGGVGTTFNYEKILNHPQIDFCCVGEGEEALVELCNKLMNNEDCTKIKNIYTKDKDGKIIKNPLRPLLKLDDILTPDFSIYEPYRFYRPFHGRIVKMICVDFDRGCPFKCTYCASPALKDVFDDDNCGTYFRMKSLDKIFEEMKLLIKSIDANFVFFGSETFLGMPMKKFREFAERYKKEVNLPFLCQTRLDTVTDEKARLLVEMGCESLIVAIEHGSERIRQELLNKRLTNKQIIDAFEIIAKYDMEPTINNMIGLPDETREDAFETIKLNKQVGQILKGKYWLSILTFIPFGGTKLKEVCLKKGYITGNEIIPMSWFKHSLLNMPTMTKEEIYGLEKTFVLYVALPESYWPDIKIAEQDNEEGEEMLNKLTLLKKEYLNV